MNVGLVLFVSQALQVSMRVQQTITELAGNDNGAFRRFLHDGFLEGSEYQAVNAAQDAQGRHVAMQTAFALHHLNHSHAMELFGVPIDPSGVHPSVRKKRTGGDSPEGPRPKTS